MDPVLQQAGVDLAALAAKNTASSIFDRVRVARANREKDETIRELEAIVNDLIADRLELQRLAEVYRESVAAQTISDDDLAFIASHIVPILTSLGVPDIEKFEALLSSEFLRIAQALGFSFKQAVGQPLTEVAAAQITKRLSPPGGAGPQSRAKK
ncbi:MAG: hypothetical protein QOC92_2020 [Acidimicrobiaceae bacterium]|jgi:hypothetical protein